MAKAFFKCAKCGTDVLVEGRNRSDADRLAASRESRHETCSDCWQAERAAENQAALAAASTSGLPALTGSPKQVAWAAKIRQDALPDIDAALVAMQERARTNAARHSMSPAALQETLDALALIACEERDQTCASWWIDHYRSLHSEAIAERLVSQLRRRAADLAPTALAEETAILNARAQAGMP